MGCDSQTRSETGVTRLRPGRPWSSINAKLLLPSFVQLGLEQLESV